MAEEQQPQEATKTPAKAKAAPGGEVTGSAKTPAAGATATKAPKKEKPPALEEKPCAEFINQHYLPTLESALSKMGLAAVELSLEQGSLAVEGADGQTYSQVKGQWPDSSRRFSVVFTQEDIKGPKFFYCSEGDTRASTVEQFMGDERKITLDLLVLYTLQRLNGQKWLERN
jgi:hypothetical protein